VEGRVGRKGKGEHREESRVGIKEKGGGRVGRKGKGGGRRRVEVG
jgi:hypothetical protein